MAVVGDPLPDRRLYEGRPGEFARAAGTAGRTWLFHAEVQRADAVRKPRWNQLVRADKLFQLSQLLGLPGSYRVHPLEILPGHEPRPRHRSPWVFSQQTRVPGPSKDLALLAGLASLDQRRGVPPWVVASGAVGLEADASGSPRVEPVGKLREKLELALGIGEGNAEVAGLLDLWYKFPIEKYLGPRGHRSVPGGIRLFLGPRMAYEDTLGYLRGAYHQCDLEFDVPTLRRLFAGDPPGDAGGVAEACGGLPRGVPGGATDWLLYVPVANAAEALAVQGLVTPGAWDPGTRPITCRLLVRRQAANGRQVGEDRDWKARLGVLLECLHLRMQGCTNQGAELREVLDLLIDEVNRQPWADGGCFNGTVGQIREDRRHIDVVERVFRDTPGRPGFGQTELFKHFPLGPGPTALAVSERKPSLAPDMRGNREVQAFFDYELTEYVKANPELAPLVPAQRQFLSQIGSYICVPICEPTLPEPLAVLSLLLRKRFDPDRVPSGFRWLVRELASQAAYPLGKLIAVSKAVPKEFTSGEPDASWRFLFRQPGGPANGQFGRVADFRKACANELTERVCRLPYVYRAAVRFLDGQGKLLSLEGSRGEYDEPWKRHSIPVAGKPREFATTAEYAMWKRRHVFLDDTKYLLDSAGQTIPHFPVGPTPAAAHATVLLEFCGQVLGVLSVDFNTTLIPPAVRTALQAEAARYSVLLKASRIEDEFAQLYQEDLPDDACIRHVAHMIGAQYGAYFVRQKGTGLYTPEASVGHSDSWRVSWPTHYGAGIRGGAGLVGWIVENRRPLRLANVRDDQELRQVTVGVGLPRVVRHDLGEPDLEGEPVAFLGVPVAVEEVFGVMRFAKSAAAPGTGFSTYDEQVAHAAAHRLANKIQQAHRKKQMDAVRDLLELSLTHPEQGERQQLFVRKAFEKLRETIGECSCGIRLSDEVELRDRRQLALRRLDKSDPAWKPPNSPLYRYREGEIAVRSFVWQEEIDAPDRHARPDAPGLVEGMREQFGHFFMCPLGQNAGVLSVTRKVRGQVFSPTDLTFVRRLSRLLGPMILQVAREEQLWFENELLKRLVHQFDGANLIRSMGEVLRLLRTVLQPDWACMWIREGSYFRPHAEKGQPWVLARYLEEKTVKLVMGAAGARSVTVVPASEYPGQRLMLGELLHDTGAPSDWAERDRTALAVRDSLGAPLVVFVLVARADETFSYRQVTDLAATLQSLSGFVVRNRA